MNTEEFERKVTNCFACGKPVEAIRISPLHHPEPESDAHRCRSHPRKYSHLQCMYALGHECAHTAKVAGTGLHCWSDSDAVS
ncbi:MAG TPA: hypothetical protein VJ853_04140 [Thermoanaerobaculia bacterium]|nr:hypothetical protein [Thermoanaerobaculia bacterium]